MTLNNQKLLRGFAGALFLFWLFLYLSRRLGF